MRNFGPPPDCVCPHAWYKFKQAERNMMKLIRCQPYKRKRFRAIIKWARTMRSWSSTLF